jgi:DNA processing protein
VTATGACRDCLRRTWLLAALAGYLERAHRQADRVLEALSLGDGPLLALPGSLAGSPLAEGYDRFEPEGAREAAQRSGLGLICRHDSRYPAALTDLPAPPATLQVKGALPDLSAALAGPAVAIVGSREPSDYGRDMARALARGASAAGVTVISGLAYGIDACAHSGAVAGGGSTVGVLAGGADVAYPARGLTLYRRVAGSGGVLSEMPPGFRAFRWCFLARNRIVAGLARAVIVVEATAASGSLLTARLARELGRPVGAVPGRVTSTLAVGPLELLRTGAHLVRGAEDVLELACGPGAVPRATPPPAPGSRALLLDPPLRRLLEAVSNGRDTPELLIGAGHSPAEISARLGELELRGHIRRTLDGRYAVVPA